MLKLNSKPSYSREEVLTDNQFTYISGDGDRVQLSKENLDDVINYNLLLARTDQNGVVTRYTYDQTSQSFVVKRVFSLEEAITNPEFRILRNGQLETIARDINRDGVRSGAFTFVRLDEFTNVLEEYTYDRETNNFVPITARTPKLFTLDDDQFLAVPANVPYFVYDKTTGDITAIPVRQELADRSAKFILIDVNGNQLVQQANTDKFIAAGESEFESFTPQALTQLQAQTYEIDGESIRIDEADDFPNLIHANKMKLFSSKTAGKTFFLQEVAGRVVAGNVKFSNFNDEVLIEALAEDGIAFTTTFNEEDQAIFSVYKDPNRIQIGQENGAVIDLHFYKNNGELITTPANGQFDLIRSEVDIVGLKEMDYEIDSLE